MAQSSDGRPGDGTGRATQEGTNVPLVIGALLASIVAGGALLGWLGSAWLADGVLAGVDAGRLAQLRWQMTAGGAGSGAVLASFVVLATTHLLGRLRGRMRALARVAEAVAAGDLTIDPPAGTGTAEMDRLARAVSAMVGELRRLTHEIAAAARDTAAMAAEITAGTDQMSASAGEMASTSSELSQQSATMAQTLQAVAGDAARLTGIATELASGAGEAATRNGTVQTLAVDIRGRLEEETRVLEGLAADATRNSAAIAALADASEEIGAFVMLVRKMARQSKLLALNASMEAARAGEHGHGFAVVANEVRRLAASSAEAAERTDAVVRGVLERVAASRESSEQTAAAVGEALTATRAGLESFGVVQQAVTDAGAWAETIARAARESDGLAHEMTARLDSLARGTESFAAAMQQVAASSEEQSASTAEIAHAATTLATAADRLSQLAATFRRSGPSGAASGHVPGRSPEPAAITPLFPSAPRVLDMAAD